MEASGRVMFRAPVAAPMNLKLLLAGVPDDPASHKYCHGREAVPRLTVPAALGFIVVTADPELVEAAFVHVDPL
jgi:hypothetical protein